jgi:hypothetical protein
MTVPKRALDVVPTPDDPINQTEEGVFAEISERANGLLAAAYDAAMNFPSRPLSVAITNLETGVLWLRAAAPDRWCGACGAVAPDSISQDQPEG